MEKIGREVMVVVGTLDSHLVVLLIPHPALLLLLHLRISEVKLKELLEC